MLLYYEDPGDLYFPSGTINLRNGVQASVIESGEGKGQSAFFNITTVDRVWYFRADSVPSAKEWVKALNKVIFRSHNDGDGVKVVLPIEGIFGLEESPVLEFADTFKLDFLNQVDHTTDEVSPRSGLMESILTNYSISFLSLVLEKKLSSY